MAGHDCVRSPLSFSSQSLALDPRAPARRALLPSTVPVCRLRPRHTPEGLVRSLPTLLVAASHLILRPGDPHRESQQRFGPGAGAKVCPAALSYDRLVPSAPRSDSASVAKLRSPQRHSVLGLPRLPAQASRREPRHTLPPPDHPTTVAMPPPPAHPHPGVDFVLSTAANASHAQLYWNSTLPLSSTMSCNASAWQITQACCTSSAGVFNMRDAPAGFVGGQCRLPRSAANTRAWDECVVRFGSERGYGKCTYFGKMLSHWESFRQREMGWEGKWAEGWTLCAELGSSNVTEACCGQVGGELGRDRKRSGCRMRKEKESGWDDCIAAHQTYGVCTDKPRALSAAGRTKLGTGTLIVGLAVAVLA